MSMMCPSFLPHPGFAISRAVDMQSRTLLIVLTLVFIDSRRAELIPDYFIIPANPAISDIATVSGKPWKRLMCL